MQGSLYLCATPIGNLEDMSMRAVRTLKEVDLIAAEDTRNSIRILNHFDIHTKMTSYHEFNKVDKAVYLVRRMLAGENVALITDAGTPGISDPGEELVRRCHDAGIRVTSIPGACAAINGLIISGLPTRRFVFEGFLPRDTGERQKVLESLKKETRTIILYEAPHHLVRTLRLLGESLGDERQVVLIREMTKRFEERKEGSIRELLSFYEEEKPRGEYVVIVEGKNPRELFEEEKLEWEKMSLSDHMEFYEKQGFNKKEAMKKVAKDRGVKKRDIYQQLIKAEDV